MLKNTNLTIEDISHVRRKSKEGEREGNKEGGKERRKEQGEERSR